MATIICTMPGVGKTTLAKSINKQYSSQERPVIDLDYYGPRNIGNYVKEAHSLLVREWIDSGVKAVFTFYSFLDYSRLWPSDEVFFVIPEDVYAIQSVINDVYCRDNNADFASEYAEDGSRWYADCVRSVVECIKERGCAKVRWLRAGEHLSDAAFWDGRKLIVSPFEKLSTKCQIEALEALAYEAEVRHYARWTRELGHMLSGNDFSNRDPHVPTIL